MRGLVSAALLLAGESMPASADALTGAELEQMIVGHSWEWTSVKFGQSGVSTYYRDGMLIVSLQGWGDRPERGRWRIDGDALCTRLLNNRETCTSGIMKIDENTLFSERFETTFVLKD